MKQISSIEFEQLKAQHNKEWGDEFLRNVMGIHRGKQSVDDYLQGGGTIQHLEYDDKAESQFKMTFSNGKFDS